MDNVSEGAFVARRTTACCARLTRRRMQMAEEAVDLAVKVGGLQPASPCVTRGLSLAGAFGWHPALFAELAQSHALDIHTAKYLAHAYGDRACAVLEVRPSCRRCCLAARLTRLLRAACKEQQARCPLGARPPSAGGGGGVHGAARVLLHGEGFPCASLAPRLSRRRCREAGASHCLDLHPLDPFNSCAAHRRCLASSSSWATSCAGAAPVAASRLHARPRS